MNGHTVVRAALATLLGASVLAAFGAPGAGASAAATAGPVPAIPGLSSTAIALMNSAPYANGIWGVMVADARTGETLISYNADMMLAPASVTKTYSVGAAWLAFGPDHRIITPVVRTGPVARGTLSGSLVLIAKGDITMGGQTGPDGHVVFANLDHNDANAVPGMELADTRPLSGLDSLARQVRRSGIVRVEGDVVVDDRLFVTQDLGENDGPVSPIVINNNLIDLVTTATSPGRRAAVVMRPIVAPYRVDNRVRTVAAGGRTAIDVVADGSGRLTVTGTIPVDAPSVLRVWHVDEPAAFARTAFIEALRRAGITVAAPAVAPNSTVGLGPRAVVDRLPTVARLRGLPLAENATYILKVSYNRGAQTLVCLLAVAAGSRLCDDGLAAMAGILATAGVGPRGAALVDGSGAPGNYITARSGASLMDVFAHRADAARWRAALPVLGVDGSLAKVGVDSPARGMIAAKTGTNGAGDLLNGRLRLETKALSGYVTAKSGRELVMTLMVNQAFFDDIYGVFAANEDLGTIAASVWESF